MNEKEKAAFDRAVETSQTNIKLMQLESEVRDLYAELRWLETRLQSALDGNGVRAWSEEYLREIIRECSDRIQEIMLEE